MHFAGETLVAKSVREPSAFYSSNVAGGINLLDSMVRHGVNKIIFSSTAATYGEPETVPIPEDHRKLPINPYGKSKLTFEHVLADYRAYTGLKFATVRYFNAAGASKERGEAHRTESHLIPRVLDTALGAYPMLEIFGSDFPTPDGTCVRDYVHVLDIADSHLRTLEEIDRVPGEAFNVGTSSGYSNLQIVETAERLTGRKIPHKLASTQARRSSRLVASNEKLKKTLGWELPTLHWKRLLNRHGIGGRDFQRDIRADCSTSRSGQPLIDIQRIFDHAIDGKAAMISSRPAMPSFSCNAGLPSNWIIAEAKDRGSGSATSAVRSHLRPHQVHLLL